jgi:hypothetical protein
MNRVRELCKTTRQEGRFLELASNNLHASGQVETLLHLLNINRAMTLHHLHSIKTYEPWGLQNTPLRSTLLSLLRFARNHPRMTINVYM